MSDNNPADESLLDLYRSEAETQMAVLTDGLDGIGIRATSPGDVEPLARAAHSLKGAARIVGLDGAARLAGAMEEILMLVQQRKFVLDVERADVLLRAAESLARFSQLPIAELASPSAEILAEQAACLVEVENLLKAGEEKPQAKAVASTPKPAPPPAKSAPAPVAAPTPVAPAPPPVSTSPPPSSSSNLDLSLLELYRSEAETQLALLAQGLVEIEGDVGNLKKIEPLMRAAHSLKGAGRIVRLEPVVHLAHVMEDVLVAAQNSKLALTPGIIDALLRATDWLAQFSKLSEAELASPPEAQRTAQAACLQDVQVILAGGEPAGMQRKKGSTRAPMPVPQQVPTQPTHQTAEKSAPAAPTVTPHPSPSAQAKVAPAAAAESEVRVSSGSLTRLMGLAAETLVETRRLQPFRDALLKIKNAQLQFLTRLEAAASAQAGEGAATGLALDGLRSAAQANLDALRAQLENFDSVARRNTLLSGRLYQEVIASRMRPFGEGAHGFPRLVRDVARSLGKMARLEIEGRDTPVDRDILERLEAPLNHLLRNACDHGLESTEERKAAGKPETGVIKLNARHSSGMLALTVSDDGRGVNMERLRKKVVEKGLSTAEMTAQMDDEEMLQFLFLPGFSTSEKVTEISGRGVGLDVVQTLIQEVGGTVRINTALGKGTTFILHMPITRSVLRALMVDVEGEPYAFPLNRINRAVRAAHDDVKTIENRPYLVVDGANVGLVTARAALGLPGEGHAASEGLNVIVLGDGKSLYGLEVDKILGESELVVRPLDARLGKVPGISASSLTEDGSPILIVDVDDLLAEVEKLLAGGQIARGRRVVTKSQVACKRVLVVDDSLTVRETERQILESAGYEVEVAVDGADGWNAVRLGRFDLVVSDVDMPRMNGFEFVKRIRGDSRLQRIPVIIVSYKDREEDRLRGLEAGADHYLTKSSFQDDTFMRAVTELVGKAEGEKE